MFIPIVLTLCAAPNQDPPISAQLEGTWGGFAMFGESAAWIQIRERDGTLLVDDIAAGLNGLEAQSLKIDGSRVQFEFESEEGLIGVDGVVTGRTFTGKHHTGGEILGSFELTRFHSTSPQEFERHLGRYETPDGQVFWAIPRTFGGIRLISHVGYGETYGSYSFDAWLPLTESTYFTSDYEGSALPPSRTLTFDGDALYIVGEESVIARRSGGSVRSVSFKSGDFELQGWLMAPPGTGPLPSIAYAHGSGYVSADHAFDLYTTVRLVRDVGVAVLRWDKRGVWKSEGDQGVASYHDLAEDINAAADWLRAQEELDESLVGLGGLSQAPSGPLPIAASRSKDIAFVVATSGFLGTPVETNLFNWSNKMAALGMPPDEIECVVAFFRELLPFTLDPSPEGQQAYDEFLGQHAQESWYEYAYNLALLGTPLNDPTMDRWRAIHDVDAANYWRQVHCPVYQSWGEDDPLVDAERCSLAMAALVAETGQTNFTSVVYPSPADHGVGSGNTPTFFRDLKAWFEEDVRAKGPVEDR